MTENLPERVEPIEQKLDALAVSVDRRFEEVDRRFEQIDRRFEQIDRRFEQIDRRFDEVTDALVEQRQYTEFAFDRLRQEMLAHFQTMPTKDDLAALRTEVVVVVHDVVGTVRQEVGRLEGKLDQFIDIHAAPRRRVRRPPKKR